MNTIKKRTFTIIIATIMSFAMMPLVPYDAGRAYAESFVIPPADVTYTEDNEWEGTLEINENKTIKLIDIEHDNNGTQEGTAIKITGGSTVNIVFEGNVILGGNSVAPDPNNPYNFIDSAGIEAEKDSTVNIYGTDGSSLTVTGGHFGAGIGGVGYGSPNESNLPAGNINIYSGTITAIGGYRGAGIGSGRSSSASKINIYGGDITALGTAGGAGIGSGYGTSGGASQGAGVGYYKGGNITISGGKVFAAAYHINKDNFDIYNTDTFYDEGYSDTWAAGIGGGYGASSGNIVIEGDADVTAIGSAGGAGIGSGRGTTQEKNYDADNFDCNVTIRGNAKVNAIATHDTRSGQNLRSGAAIGLGYGCTLNNQPKGTVKIENNAVVYAVGSYQTAAIGGSFIAYQVPVDAHLATITIGSNTTVTAVSDGYRPAVDLEPSDFISLSADQQYFENRGDFYTEDKFPLKIDTVKAGSTSAESTFAVQSPEAVNVMVHMPNIDKYSFTVKDHKGDNGERIYLSNAVEENSAQFMYGSEYDLYGLTERLDSDASVDSQYGSIDVKIQAAEGIFEYGSTFLAEAAGDYAAANLDKSYSDILGKVLFFDVGVKDRAGTNYAEYEGGKPVISIQLPNGWDKSRTQALLVNAGADKSFAGSQKITTSGGKTYVSFETTRGGTFALLEQKADPAPTPSKVSGTLLARMTAKGKSSLVLTWNKVNGAEGYDIFFERCNHNDKKTTCKKVKTIKGNKTFKWTKSRLSKGKAYKAYVKAYVMKDGKKSYVKTSPTIHAYTSGGNKKYTNAKSVTVNKTSVSLKKGKTFKIKASVTKLQKGKKFMPSWHAPKLRYVSENKKVVTVSKGGKITAKATGKCKVYVIAVNGARKAITVTVN